MARKRVHFDIDSEEQSNSKESELNLNEESKEDKLPFNKKFKHTLDSDESDDEVEDSKKYELNQQEIFDGEEEGNLHREGEITITPFNTKDELKEGHFDNDGMFIFKKNVDEIKDSWIDNIDWAQIKEQEQTSSSKLNESEDEVKVNKQECYTKLIELMNPNETVQKAMQRLGKSKLKNSNQNRNKNRQKIKNKDQSTMEDSEELREDKKRKENLNNLIEYSNLLLSDGDMNIYETKYEALKYRLDECSKIKENDLDIFAD